MRWLFVFTITLIGLQAYSQTGFNHSHDFGGLAAGFASIELTGDTIIVYGTALEEGETAFGLLFAKMDTFGNVIDFHIYNDSLGDDFTLQYPNSLVRLSDGSGYVGVGQLFYRGNAYFAKFDNSGVLVEFKELVDSIYSNNIFSQIIELDNGFLIGGTEFSPSTSIEVSVQKVDSEGNPVWEKRYGSNNKRDLFGSFTIIDENEFVIGASTTSVNGVPLPQVKNTSKIFAIDSLGNLKWEWESQPSLEELGVGSLFKTPEGNWAYTSSRGWYNATYNEISKQPKFIIRDENFNIIRDDTFGIADFPINYFTKAILLKDNGWLAIGLKPVNYPIAPVPIWYNSFSGWMVRLDNQANQVWSRIDTAFWSAETGSTNYLYDALELPSGSIIACGYSRTYEPSVKDWGWLIKVSKDGCLDTLSCTPLNTTNNDLSKITYIYPNPTQSIINISSEWIQFWDRVELLDVSGRVILSWNNTTESKLDLSNIEDGAYLIRLIKSNQSVTKKVIKKR